MTENLPARRDPTPPAVPDVDSWTGVIEPVSRLAGVIADTEFVPKGLRGSAAAVTAALLYGREVGLPPMTALTQTHVIEGKPAISAEAMRALVLAAGHELVFEEKTGAHAIAAGRRRGSDRWSRVEWTLDMARAAGLTTKAVWKSYPRAMLAARATAELCRDLFPDVIRGFRATEELEDDTAAPEGSTPAPAAATTRVRRARGAATAPVAEAPVPAQGRIGPGATRPRIPLPGEDEPKSEVQTYPTPVTVSREEVGEPVEGPPSVRVLEVTDPDGAPVEPPKDPAPKGPAKVKPAQLRMLNATLARLLGPKATRDLQLDVVRAIAGLEDLATRKDLTPTQASQVIDTLARCRDRDALEALLNALPDPAADDTTPPENAPETPAQPAEGTTESE